MFISIRTGKSYYYECLVVKLENISTHVIPHTYHLITYSRSCISHNKTVKNYWILEIFPTLYTCSTIPHVLLKNRLIEIIHNAFQHKNGSTRYKYITLGYQTAYIVNSEQKGNTCYTKEQTIDRLSAFLWKQTARLSLPTYSYFHLSPTPSDTCKKTRSKSQIIEFHI